MQGDSGAESGTYLRKVLAVRRVDRMHTCKVSKNLDDV